MKRALISDRMDLFGDYFLFAQLSLAPFMSLLGTSSFPQVWNSGFGEQALFTAALWV